MFITHGEHARAASRVPLQDRMEIIQLSGYTEFEKLNIATQYLVPQQREANGLDGRRTSTFTDERDPHDHPPLHAARPACAASSARSRRSAARSRATS